MLHNAISYEFYLFIIIW